MLPAQRGSATHLVRRLPHPRGWTLWTLPRQILGYLVAVEVGAATLTVALVAGHAPSWRHLAVAATLLAAGVGQGEAGRHIERTRCRFADTPHVNLTSVWTFPAAVLLPPGWAAVVVAGLYLHLWRRCWYQASGVPAHRLVFNASAAVLAAQAAGAVHAGSDLPNLIVSIGAYAATNALLVAGAIALTAEQPVGVRRLFGGWNENVLEVATLCLGAVAAILLRGELTAVLLLAVPVFVLHRSALIRQLEEAASTDEKTGLLNATRWHELTRRELAGRPTVGVLMVDLDHFKLINDRYGHLAGDRVLRRVADALAEEVRRDDLVGLVGRFGGEEFVVAVPNVTARQLGEIAERICTRVRRLAVDIGSCTVSGMTASVGGALYPHLARQLDELLMAADNALFQAKHAGRDRACLA
jgi:diguanylate cyclase (GGDEF)-like protein